MTCDSQPSLSRTLPSFSVAPLPHFGLTPPRIPEEIGALSFHPLTGAHFATPLSSNSCRNGGGAVPPLDVQTFPSPLACKHLWTSRKCCKQKRLTPNVKSFRCNTYKKHEGPSLQPNVFLVLPHCDPRNFFSPCFCAPESAKLFCHVPGNDGVAPPKAAAPLRRRRVLAATIAAPSSC